MIVNEPGWRSVGRDSMARAQSTEALDAGLHRLETRPAERLPMTIQFSERPATPSYADGRRDALDDVAQIAHRAEKTPSEPPGYPERRAAQLAALRAHLTSEYARLNDAELGLYVRGYYDGMTETDAALSQSGWLAGRSTGPPCRPAHRPTRPGQRSAQPRICASGDLPESGCSGPCRTDSRKPVRDPEASWRRPRNAGRGACRGARRVPPQARALVRRKASVATVITSRHPAKTPTRPLQVIRLIAPGC
jgi:hypothetical protein